MEVMWSANWLIIKFEEQNILLPEPSNIDSGAHCTLKLVVKPR